jgi:hypothetical protein
MSNITITTPSKPEAIAVNGDESSKFDALCRLIKRGQGRFVLALVSFDLPSLQDKLIHQLKSSLLPLNVIVIRLTPLPADAPRSLNVLDQLTSLVKYASPANKPDAIIVLGYESLLPNTLDLDSGDNLASEQLARAIQPLNLGRNILAQTFSCPLVLCLPMSAMAMFLQSAPDLNSWRSGFYSFSSDLALVRKKLISVAKEPLHWWARWRLRRRSPEELHARVKNLETLIADAKALPADNLVIAKLYERLGWTLIALGDRTQARGAFAEVLQRSREMGEARLVTSAERGQRAAAKVIPRAKVVVGESVTAQQVFRGASVLTEGEGVYGRETELAELLTRVTSVEPRLLTVWGETGCGKSSLVLAGLVPELKRIHDYMPIIIREWDTPELNIRNSIEQASSPSVKTSDSIYEVIRNLANQTGKTVILICDQFEQFFSLHPRREERAQLLNLISTCVNDLRVACKFVFIVREDALGRLVEFENYIPEVLEQRKRFYLTLFSSSDATRILRQMANKAGLTWPNAFIQCVVEDLTSDGRVRPIHLQLVGAALVLAGIDNEQDYVRADRSRGLLIDYIELVIGGLSHRKRSTDMMKRILLTLVADPPARLTLPAAEVARRTGLEKGFVDETLNKLVEVHLVRRSGPAVTVDSKVVETPSRYELTHDALVDLVLIVTRGLQDNRREANRILRRAIEDSIFKPRRVVGLREWRLIERYANEEEIEKPEAKALLRRSLYWGLATKVFLPIILLVTGLTLIQTSSGYVSIEQDLRSRVVVRRGLPSLSFLPIIGNSVVLDTGLTSQDLDPMRAVSFNRQIHWELGNRQSGVLKQDALINSIELPVERGLLLYEVGRKEQGISLLTKELSTNYSSFRVKAAEALGNIIHLEHETAEKTVEPLLSVINDKNNKKPPLDDGSLSRAIVMALGEAAEANPGSADKIVDSLLQNISPGLYMGKAYRYYYDRDDGDVIDYYYSSSNPSRFILNENQDVLSGAFSRAARANPNLVKKLSDNLFERLELTHYYELDARYEKSMLAQSKKAKNKESSKEGEIRQLEREVNQFLKFRSQYRELARILRVVARANPKSIFSDLQVKLESDNMVTRAIAMEGLRGVVQGDPAFADKLFNALTTGSKKRSISSKPTRLRAYRIERQDRYAAIFFSEQRAFTLAGIAQADPKLAHKVLDVLTNSNHTSYKHDFQIDSDLLPALDEMAQADPEAANMVLDSWLRLRDDHQLIGEVIPKHAVKVLRDNPELAEKLVDSLLESINYKTDENGYSADRTAATTSLGRIAQASPAVTSKIVDPLLAKLEVEIVKSQERIAAIKVLGDLAQADSLVADKIINPLLAKLKVSDEDDPSSEERLAAIKVLGDLTKIYPQLSAKVYSPLLEALKNWNLQEDAGEALGKAALSDPATASKITAAILNGPDPELRWKTLWVFGKTPQLAPEATKYALQILASPNDTERSFVRDSLCDMLVSLAEKELHPTEFLLDHLEGRRSIAQNEDANIMALYRDVATGALARWLIRDKPEEKDERDLLRRRLDKIREQDSQYQVRVAAWKALIEATQLKDNPKTTSDE